MESVTKKSRIRNTAASHGEQRPNKRRSKRQPRGGIGPNSKSVVPAWTERVEQHIRNTVGHVTLSGAANFIPATAASVRAVYVAEYSHFIHRTQRRETLHWQKVRPDWDGGHYRGIEYKPIWPRIASLVSDECLPVLFFVQARFATRCATPATPDELLNVNGLPSLPELFQQKLLVVAKQLLQDLEIYREWKSVPEPEDDLPRDPVEASRALHHAPPRPSPLFCYARALMNGEERLAQYYKAEATRQFIDCPEVFSLAWSPLLPAGFVSQTIKSAYGVSIG